MSGRYIITTPLNPGYSGKVCGVRIEQGRGILDSSTIDPRVGLTVEQALIQLSNMPGYVVEPMPGYEPAEAAHSSGQPVTPQNEEQAKPEEGNRKAGYKKQAE